MSVFRKTIKYIFNRDAMILMYHRIASPVVDPWQLAVSAENFEQHLKILQGKNIVKPLPEIIEQLKKKTLNRKCIAITFDDGYADNFHTAKPLLEKYELPATFFITSKNVDSTNEFWWDELANILLLAPTLPQKLLLKLNDHSFFYDLAGETLLTGELLNKHKNYIAYNPETLRARLYYKLWEYFSPLSDADQQELIDQVRKWAVVEGETRRDYHCLSSGQISKLSDDALFDVGGHTVSHPALPDHPPAKQEQEILGNKLFLEKLTGKEINLFAYPSGKYNDATKEVLRQMNFNAAFTTHAKPVKTSADPYELGRFQVNNWTGDELKKNLYQWTN